jgi:hypothetical protein
MNGMPKFFHTLGRLVKRFQHPRSWVKDVADDLGVQLPPDVSLEAMLLHLQGKDFRPRSLFLSMPRRRAEEAFQKALKKEVYESCSLFSYYFDPGWLVMALYFDQFQHLSKVFVSCPAEFQCKGFSILLDK